MDGKNDIPPTIHLFVWLVELNKMPPRTPAGQGRIAFGVAPGSAAAAAAGAIVDVDDQDDQAVLVAEQQKQQKEKTRPVLFTEERPRDVGIGKASCVFKGRPR